MEEAESAITTPCGMSASANKGFENPKRPIFDMKKPNLKGLSQTYNNLLGKPKKTQHKNTKMVEI